MIWEKGGIIKMEDGEPALRSCWECNGAHEHLKMVNFLHTCFECGRYWVFDKFFDEFKTDEEFDNFFISKGMKSGQSTQEIDAGYRIYCYEMKVDEKNKDT